VAVPRSADALLASLAVLALPLLAHGTAGAASLADGPGRDAVEAMCTGCHQTNQITNSAGYTAEGWRELTGTMIDLSADPPVHEDIIEFLSAYYPPNDRRAAKLVDGPLKIELQEWVAPTLGQRSRDPVEAPDGAIWWVGQWADLAGRIDPKTGAMKEFALPAGARPHSINIDAAGTVWYTGNGNGTIGKLDPATGKVTEYKMPDPAARDPHTAEFDHDGILWFTLQQSNMVGRLDPATGDIKLKTMPTADSKPYGIKIDAEGAPWVACNGRNCLVRIDPQTMALKEIALPGAQTTVRRLDIAEDGMIWYVNSSLGKLGRYDPRTGAIEEWDSPSGAKSHPYAIAVVNGIVWYNESGVRPDPLVRFDPARETFQSWPIPSGGVHAGIVRHMRPTRDGKLLIHQSSTNRIIQVTLPAATY
jgi:virginiamycin B lyase